MTRAVIAWTAAVISVALVIAGWVFAGLNGTGLEEQAVGFGLGTSVGGASFAFIGALITTRRPGNVLGPLFLVVGVTQALNSFTGEYSTYALETAPGSLPLGALMGQLALWTWAPGFGLFTTAVILLFPDGTLPSPRWRWTMPVVGIAMALLIVPMAIAATSIEPAKLPQISRGELPTPNAVDVAFVLQQIGVIVSLAMMVVAIVGTVIRFRRSRGDERQQLKWFAFSAVATLAFVIFVGFIQSGISNVIVVAALAIVPLVGGLPTGVAIAIFKYRLYDIDVVVNKTLVYATLTAVLGGAYVGLVFGFQSLLAPVTEESDLAIAASTLAVAALFRPVRTRVQAFIDRRFYRRKFDVGQTLENFTSELRDEVDLAALSSRLTGVVAETMQPTHVSLWLRNDPMTVS